MTDDLQCVPDEYGLCVHCRNLVIGDQTCSAKFKRRHAPPSSTADQAEPQPMLANDTTVGLGDAIESALTAIGLTKERYAQVKQLFGFPPSCGCDARREWLNKVSDWWRRTSMG